jgi:acetolactate synthase I/II/III large subunit
METMTGAEAIVEMLRLYGVRHIFGLCGDTSLPFYDALARLEHGMEHILTRDERSAAYMADGYARVSGKVGVCEGPSGGGATYILPGLVEANESSIPVLGITTDISTESRGRYALTELDQRSLFRPLTKWNGVIDRPEKLPELVRAAFRAMTTGKPGAAHLCLPFDVQEGSVSSTDVWVQPEHGSFPAWRCAPDPAAVAEAADRLARARLPVFVCGGGAVISGAHAELEVISELLDAPVATSISGQGSLSEAHPLCLGVVGGNGGTPDTRDVLCQADLIIFVGCRAGSVTTEKWRFPARNTPIIHIDVDPQAVGANYRVEVALIGDAKLVMRALIDELKAKKHSAARGGRTLVAMAKNRKFSAFSNLAQKIQSPLLPELIVATLHDTLPHDAVVVCDPGTPCPYLSAYYEFVEPGRYFVSNRAHGALGYSMAAAVGAYFGRPRAKIVSVMGDGSFGFTVGELETIVRLRIPITMLVISNGTYGWIKAGQKAGFEARYFSVDFTLTNHARIAEAFGVKAWHVEDPSDLRPALAAAVEFAGPTLIDIMTQPLHEAHAPVSEWVA